YAYSDYADSTLQWELRNLQHILMSQVLLHTLKLRRLVDVDHLVGEARGRVGARNEFQYAGLIADLLLQLSKGALARVLTGVQLAGWNLVNITADRMPVLSDQDHGPRVLQRHRRRCAWMVNHLQLDRGTVRKRHRFQIEVDDRALGDVLGHDAFSF